MTSNLIGVPLLPDGEKFDGTGYSGYKTKIQALAKAHGLGGYLDGTIQKPSPMTAGGTAQSTMLPPEPTSIYSTTPSYDEWVHCDAIATALLVLNIKNPVGLGLKVDGSAHKAMQSLDNNHHHVTEMGLVNALHDLHSAYLVPGTPMAEHISRLRTLWQVANNMGAKIEDKGFRSILISLLGEEWDTVVPVLHTFTTSVEVISFVTMHANCLNRVPASLWVPPPRLLPTRTMTVTHAALLGKISFVPTRRGGKEGQWPSWWKGKRFMGAATVNYLETFAFTATTNPAVMWTAPEAIINVYDDIGVQTVTFRGEEVLASPESLMVWNEVADATVTIDIPEHDSNELQSDYPVLSTSLEFIDTISTSKLELVDSTHQSEFDINDSDDENLVFLEARTAAQIATEAFLQAGQPYPGDDHVQEDQ
ncbi:hypothetical protein DFH08DRAFT_1014072 [Mycena albidolilacea]|uniref:Uncharacterized protein n=1 Tax=Mycena albidolilacea TaxID=1033008 RepID=A0AAD6ZTP9_9AGAR|nr:hypothetical protein DFH08DRAFT_1014072 [Mycena albidolilacea]